MSSLTSGYRSFPNPSPWPGRIRIALLGLACLLFLSACVAPLPPYRAVPNFAAKSTHIESVTLVPPLVAVYAMSSGDIEQEVQDWSDDANELAQSAVRTRIEALGKTFVPYAGTRGPRPDFRLGRENPARRLAAAGSDKASDSWLLFESAKEAILRHTYDITQAFPERIEKFDYTLGQDAAALLGGTRADAFLLMTATDYVPTADRQALIGVGAAAFLYTGSYGGPGGTPAELTAALIDSRTGDILWFNKVSMPLSDLRDPKANAALVDLVLKGIE
ncbi:MAG: hypothetical protein AB8G23_03150 [Myxococcota bacterium]